MKTIAFFGFFSLVIAVWMFEETCNFLHWQSYIPEFITKYDFFLEFFIGVFCIVYNIFIIQNFLKTRKKLQRIEEKAESLQMNNELLRQGENSLWKKIEAQFKDWNFTEKERQIGELILRGLSNKQIAGYVSKSVRTVENQIQILFLKTGFTSRNEFMGYFFEPFLPEEE